MLLPLAACFAFCFLSSSQASEPILVIVSLKNPSTVVRSNAKTGSFLGSIPVRNAISVGSDRTTIAVLSSNGSVSRYNAQTGAFIGTFSVGGKDNSIQVTSGTIIVQTDNTLNRYNAKSSSFIGSSGI